MTVDDSYRIVDQLDGDILISRLQLPRTGAILANRIDVLKHQELATESEYQAVSKISHYLGRLLEDRSVKLPLVGFNSNRFDLPYLRTTFIRNGFSPYFFGRLISRDLLLLARRLSCFDERFPRPESQSESGKLSLRLESLCQHFGLLKGAQKHESSADVRLTISLAQTFREMFGSDVRRFDPYEGISFHRESGGSKAPIVMVREPEYDLSQPSFYRCRPKGLLCDDSQGRAIWVDLERYRDGEGRKALEWYQAGKSSFFVDDEVSDQKLLQLLHSARKEFSKVTTANFFPPSTCDVEQDIYRAQGVKFETLNSLEKAISSGDKSKIAGSAKKEALILFTRYRLREIEDSADPKFLKTLKAYGEYRYGGGLQLRRTIDEDLLDAAENFHPTLLALYDELTLAENAASDSETRKILASLRSFYDSSLLVRLMGGAPKAN